MSCKTQLNPLIYSWDFEPHKRIILSNLETPKKKKKRRKIKVLESLHQRNPNISIYNPDQAFAAWLLLGGFVKFPFKGYKMGINDHKNHNSVTSPLRFYHKWGDFSLISFTFYFSGVKLLTLGDLRFNQRVKTEF